MAKKRPARMPTARKASAAVTEFERKLFLSREAKPPHQKLANLYTGKAGEYLFASQLMRMGLNASILPIDNGIDVFAVRDAFDDPAVILALNRSSQFQMFFCQVRPLLSPNRK